MQPMETVRGWHIDIMKKHINILGRLVESTHQKEATTIRDGGDGWTVLEVLGHLRDFEAVFLERAHLTLEEDNPALPFPDPLAMVSDRRYNEDDLAESYRAWAGTRRQHIALLEGVSSDDDWEAPARHPTRGPFTLHDQLFLTVWHDANHIEQIAKILRGV